MAFTFSSNYCTSQYARVALYYISYTNIIENLEKSPYHQNRGPPMPARE